MIVLTWFAMLSTSVYGWASLIQLRRDRAIDTTLVVVCSILRLIFVADAVAGVLIFVHTKRRTKAVAAAAVIN